MNNTKNPSPQKRAPLWKRFTLPLLFFLLLCTAASGCGCGKKKEEDPAANQVLKITVTPEPTATPIPEQVNPDAVVTNNGVTMVNEYLLQKGASRTDTESTDAPGAGEESREESGEEQE